MACRGCGKKRRGSNPGPSQKISVFGPGHDVKIRYVGASKELLYFEGSATRKEYVVGGKINLVVADSRDLSTGISWAPGLLEQTNDAGAKLFEIHVPLKEELEAEAEARARQDEAWETAEALALPPETTVIEDTSIQTDVGIGDVAPKPKPPEEPDGEGAISGD